MSPKPFDLDAALAELRTDVSTPEARQRARQALARPSLARNARPAWRVAAVTGALALLLLPMAVRTRGSEASAVTVEKVAQATLEAPYVFVRDFVVEPDGRRRLHAEYRSGPHREVERNFFREGDHPGREVRRVPGFVFERWIPDATYLKRGWKPYETIRGSKESVSGTEGKTYSLFQDLRRVYGNVRLERLPGDMAKPGGRTWVRYRMAAVGGQRAIEDVWTVEMPSGRLVRLDGRHVDEGGGRLKTTVRECAYPSAPARNLIDLPPLGDLPRFDLDQERAEMDRLNRDGDRVATVAGRRVKLVGVFQEVCAPDQRVYVAYEGTGLARAKGLRGGGLTTMKSIPPKVVATVFASKGPLRTLDVEIPAPGGGYAAFRGVRVRPVSSGIRSALRTPPFE